MGSAWLGVLTWLGIFGGFLFIAYKCGSIAGLKWARDNIIAKYEELLSQPAVTGDCPWCGNNFKLDIGTANGKRVMFCRSCWCSGPPADNDDAAIKRWCYRKRPNGAPPTTTREGG